MAVKWGLQQAVALHEHATVVPVIPLRLLQHGIRVRIGPVVPQVDARHDGMEVDLPAVHDRAEHRRPGGRGPSPGATPVGGDDERFHLLQEGQRLRSYLGELLQVALEELSQILHVALHPRPSESGGPGATRGVGFGRQPPQGRLNDRGQPWSV